MLLENLRFHLGETGKNASEEEVEQYVNDAFAVCHRKHASVYRLPKLFSPEHRGAGLLVEREAEALSSTLKAPQRPLIAIFGGAKISSKLKTVAALAERADRLLIGGTMSYAYLRALGREVWNSQVKEDQLEAARQALNAAGNKILLPVDHVIGRIDGTTRTQTSDDVIRAGFAGFDIGPNTRLHFRSEIKGAGTVLWDGPMGKFEDEWFREGTRAVARSIAESPAKSVVGGGETTEALRSFGLAEQVTHVSTRGGTFLSYLTHGTLPALEALSE